MDQEHWENEMTSSLNAMEGLAKKNLDAAVGLMGMLDLNGTYDEQGKFYWEKVEELHVLITEIISKKATLLAGQDCPSGGDDLLSWIYGNVERLALSPTADVLIHKAASISMLRLEVQKLISELAKDAAERKQAAMQGKD
jgi:hypothetical protein